MRFRFTELLHVPLERAFALTNDLDRAMEWLPAGVRIEKLTPGPTRLGSRYRETRRILGRDDTEIYEVTIYDPPHRSEVCADGTKGTAGRGEFRFRVDFAAAGPSATTVTLVATATRLGCGGLLLYPVVRGIMRRHSVADLAGLKAWIEKETREEP
jgi:carbon monoxide dehydrogenase subunit G